MFEAETDLSDFEQLFPIPITKKPDIVVCCAERKRVHLVELTVPHEDNIEAARERKNARYEKLLVECEDVGWNTTHLSVKVRCKGFVRVRLRKWFAAIGLNNREKSNALKEIQEAVEKASYWIWLKRRDDNWLEK